MRDASPAWPAGADDTDHNAVAPTAPQNLIRREICFSGVYFAFGLLIRAVIVEGRRDDPFAIFHALVRADLSQKLGLSRCHQAR